ncbi:MAG: 30S ribosomal protein S9 [bacterium]|nr:30S ribosomal protein S9 [bacterium]
MANTKKTSDNKYVVGIGRRKTATAQARLTPGKGKLTINNQEIDKIEDKITNPLILTGQFGKFDISVMVRGGGMSSQTDAIALAISRAIIAHDESLKPTLRKAGLTTRDPREKERKKPGLKRARKAPQWQKR